MVLIMFLKVGELTTIDLLAGLLTSDCEFFQLNPHQTYSLKHHLKTIDFVGLFTIVGGVVLLLVGFNSSETAWVSSVVISE